MPQMTIQDAHDLSDGITFDDKLGIFYGVQVPHIVDTLNVPDGSAYLQVGGGLWHKRNGVWADITLQSGGIGLHHSHSNSMVLENTTASFTVTLQAAYDAMLTLNYDTLYSALNHTHTLSDITDFSATLANALDAKAPTLHSHTVSDIIDLPLKPMGTIDVCLLQDRRALGADGGTSREGRYNTRVLNHIVYNPHNHASLVGDDFVIASGTWLVEITAPAYKVKKHKVMLMNEDTESIEFEGQTLESEGSSTATAMGIITSNGSTKYEVVHYTEEKKEKTGLGEAQEIGLYEIYTQVKLTRVL